MMRWPDARSSSSTPLWCLLAPSSECASLRESYANREMSVFENLAAGFTCGGGNPRNCEILVGLDEDHAKRRAKFSRE